MINVNNEVRNILKAVEGVKTVYYHPDEYNKLPIISHYEITTTQQVCVTITKNRRKNHMFRWTYGAETADECTDFAIKADKLMQDAGWYREFSMDLPPKNKIYHKSMRFFKEIFFEI